MLLKIFIVMGVTYFFEFLGFILSWIYGDERVENYFILNNIVNALQGVFIFVVLICKKTIFKKLISKFNDCKSLPAHIDSVKESQQQKELNSGGVGTSSKLYSDQPVDIIILSRIYGKQSTTSIVSNATIVTETSTVME